MRVLLLTNEFPPTIYGGAGVHVGELARALRGMVELDIRTFGDHDETDDGWRVRGFPPAHALEAADERLRPMLAALSRDVGMVAEPVTADIVHCHTWYTHLAGDPGQARLRHPAGRHRAFARAAAAVEARAARRRLRRLDLGRADRRSTMADAVIAVSEGTRADVLRLFDVPAERVHVIHNGIDADVLRTALTEADALERSRRRSVTVPYVLFVGRITRQKGIIHLVRAIQHLRPRDRGRPRAPASRTRRRSPPRWRRACGAAQASAPERDLDPARW